MRTLGLVVLCLRANLAGAEVGAPEPAGASVPILYSTDLYHPHDDPDDHFDLVTLFALPELDVHGIIIDMGERGMGRPGAPALTQAAHLTRRQIRYATGLTRNLRDPGDTAENQPDQEGVSLVLRVLEEAQVPVTVFTTGSLRDMAAAFNRRPELFREKVGRFYINAGHSSGGNEHNVRLDPNAYVCIFRSGLPIYWAPCFGEDGYATFWRFNQGEVLSQAPHTIRNFFLYALERVDAEQKDPVTALHEEWPPEIVATHFKGVRNMWCTAPLLHAAGREDETFTFEEVKVTVGDDGSTRIASGDEGVRIKTFRVRVPETYRAAMTRALAGLLNSEAFR